MDSKETGSSTLFGSVNRDDDDEPLRLSSARASSLTGATMESYVYDFHQQQLNKGFMSSQACPPVAMSLRTRESSSMALKHIFDQKINSSASSREQRQPMGGLHSTRNQSMPDLRKRMPDLDLAFRNAQDNSLPFSQMGFGSPISAPTNQNSLPQAPPTPIHAQLMQLTCLPQAAASTRPNHSSRQSAQMTIFYSGNVNVYDDVPADKAHAIMLLAGNSCSTSFKCPAPPTPSAATVPSTEAMMMKERAPSPVNATPSQLTSVTSTRTNGGAVSKNFGSPAPASASLASPPPSPAVQIPASPADGAKSSQAGVTAKRSLAGIELPHARKVSLARFLEKRKDRVQVPQDQQGLTSREKGNDGEQTGCSDKPDHGATSSISKKRSRSPSPPRRNSKGNNTYSNATGEIPMMNEHRFFH